MTARLACRRLAGSWDGGPVSLGVAAQVEFESKCCRRLIMLQFQAIRSMRFQTRVSQGQPAPPYLGAAGARISITRAMRDPAILRHLPVPAQVEIDSIIESRLSHSSFRRSDPGTFNMGERDASACMRRHQASALPPLATRHFQHGLYRVNLHRLTSLSTEYVHAVCASASALRCAHFSHTTFMRATAPRQDSAPVQVALQHRVPLLAVAAPVEIENCKIGQFR